MPPAFAVRWSGGIDLHLEFWSWILFRRCCAELCSSCATYFHRFAAPKKQIESAKVLFGAMREALGGVLSYQACLLRMSPASGRITREQPGLKKEVAELFDQCLGPRTKKGWEGCRLTIGAEVVEDGHQVHLLGSFAGGDAEGGKQRSVGCGEMQREVWGMQREGCKGRRGC